MCYVPKSCLNIVICDPIMIWVYYDLVCFLQSSVIMRCHDRFFKENFVVKLLNWNGVVL